jgi:hypothetical protein
MIPHSIVPPAAEASRIMSGCFGDREFKSRHLGEIPSSDVAKQVNRGDITVRPRCGSDCFCSVGQVHFPKQGNGRLEKAQLPPESEIDYSRAAVLTTAHFPPGPNASPETLSICG